MRRAVVVYESMFGNTRAVAEAIAAGLADYVPVDLLAVADAPSRPEGDDVLLVIGGPTHTFSMTREQTREDARRQGASGPAAIGIREWIHCLEPAQGVAVTTFCTRINKKLLPGSAAHSAEKHLRKAGFPIAAPGEIFWVVGTPGPLVDGELDRARAWGVGLAGSATVGAAG